MVDYFKKIFSEGSLGLTSLGNEKFKTLRLFSKKSFKEYFKSLDKKTQNWILENDFNAEIGQIIFVPDQERHIKEIIFGIDERKNFWNFAKISKLLPPGNYKLDNKLYSEEEVAIAWSLENYRFKPYTNVKKISTKKNNLICLFQVKL